MVTIQVEQSSTRGEYTVTSRAPEEGHLVFLPVLAHPCAQPWAVAPHKRNPRHHEIHPSL